MRKFIINIYRYIMTVLMIFIMGYLSISCFLWNADIPLDGVSEKQLSIGRHGTQPYCWYL